MLNGNKSTAEDARPSWDEYFMNIAEVVATRSTCIRRQVGAAIVKDNRILASGYNGVPRDLPHCTDRGCIRDDYNVPSGQRHELCWGVHAEQNAVVQAAMYGVAILGAVIYSTHQPCSACAKILINAGIKRIVYKHGYPDKLSEELLAESGIECIAFQKPKH